MIPHYNLLGLDTKFEDVLLGSEQVVQRLRTLSASMNLSSPAAQFYRQTRAKTSGSIKQKIQLKRSNIETPDYSFRDITDYVGFRIVTLYDDELLDAIDYVISLIEAGQALKDPLFDAGYMWDFFHDGKFNARSSEKFNRNIDWSKQDDIYYKCYAKLLDRVSFDHEKYIDNKILYTDVKEFQKRCPPFPQKSHSYSSAHLTFWARSYLAENRVQFIPVEFQIRTAIENVWAEIDHKLLYKSRNQYLWSVDYDKAISDAEAVSGNLKGLIDDLPEEIARFRRHSKTAQSIADDFWGDKASAPNWDTRTSNNNVSLCAALIAMVDDGRMSKDLSDNLSAYERTISGVFGGNIPASDGALVVLNCIDNLGKLIDGIDEFTTKHSAKLEDIIKERNKQHTRLLKMEILRLESIILLYFNHAISNTGLIDLSKTQQKNDVKENTPLTRENTAIRLYSKFCGFMDDSELKIRPVTMIYTWKSLLSNIFDKTCQNPIF